MTPRFDWRLLAALVLFSAGPAQAQIAFPGLDGLTVDESDTAYTVAVTDAASAFGLEIAPTDLTLAYTPGATAADVGLALYGDATVTFEDTDLTVSFGTADAPGVTATGTDLTAFAASLSGSFGAEGLTFDVDDAGLLWSADDVVGLYGSVTVSFDGESFAATLGDADAPGIVVDGGTLTALTVDLPDSFSLKGLPIEATDLGMAWSSSDDAVSIWGAGSVSIDGSDWDVTLGTSDDPGVTIENGTITELAMDVSGTLDLDGFSATASDLAVAWDAAEDDVELNGSGTIALGSETLDFTLGDADDPGVSIQNGALQDLDLSLSGALTAAGMALTIDALTLIESASGDFTAYGSVTAEVGGKTMTLGLGDADSPGLAFASGALTSLTASASGTVTVEAVDVALDGLTVHWDRGGDFEFYGSAGLTFDGVGADISAGDADDPGLTISAGDLTHLNVGVTSDVALHGLTLAPQALTFEWDEAASRYEMYGALDVTFAGDTVDALLGDADSPGLVVENGAITAVDLGITSDLSVDGLAIQTDALTFSWSGGTTYALYGNADLSVGGDDLDADFGSADDPGIQIENGALHSLDVDVNSDLTLGDLEVKAKDLRVEYASGTFLVTGEVEITEVFEVDVTLGSGGTPGLEIDVSGTEPRFKIEDLTISIEHADLGNIDVKNITLEFTEAGVKDVEVDVAFPGGSEVDGEILFTGDPATIDEVTVSYRADNLDDAVELFEGVQIAYISGTVENLSGSQRWIHDFGPSNSTEVTRSPYVSATLQTIYGGGVTFDGKSATFLEMSDEVTVYDFGLQFDADVEVGAYRTSTNGWGHVFGTGSLDLVLDYDRYGYLKGSVSVPYVTADATVYTDSHHDFDALVDVHFCFPHGSSYWPVSGKCYGSIDGAVRYKAGSPYSSYGAGWTRVKTFWHTYHPGGEYNFGHRSFSFSLDLSTSGIESEIESDEAEGRTTGGAHARAASARPAVTQHLSTFEVAADEAHSLLLRMNWHTPLDSAYVTVVGPDGYHELMGATVTGEDADGLPTYDTARNFGLVVSDSLANVFVTAASTIDPSLSVRETLIPGSYTAYLSYVGGTAIDSLSVSVQPFVDEGEIALAAVEGSDARSAVLTLDYTSARPDSTTIAWYRADSLGVEGRLIERRDGGDLFSDGRDGSLTVTYQADLVVPSDSVWFYATLDDGANPIQRSETVGPFVFQPDLSGVLTDTVASDSVAAGTLVWVDLDNDGHWDTASTGGLEPHDVVDADGSFSINGVPRGAWTVRVLLPDDYALIDPTVDDNGRLIVFRNEPVVLSIASGHVDR